MTELALIRCRVAACRNDGGSWSFYLLNDNNFPLGEVVLYEVGYEWGEWGNRESTDVHIPELAPGEHAELWRDGGNGVELRMELCVRVRFGGRTAQMKFEFPKLYRKKGLPLVRGLERPGWEEPGEARVR
jgi:hypothetical protein